MALLSRLRRSKFARLLVGGSVVGFGGGTAATIAPSQGVEAPEQVSLGEPVTLDIEGGAVEVAGDGALLDDGLDSPAAAAAVTLTADTPATGGIGAAGAGTTSLSTAGSGQAGISAAFTTNSETDGTDNSSDTGGANTDDTPPPTDTDDTPPPTDTDDTPPPTDTDDTPPPTDTADTPETPADTPEAADAIVEDD